MLTWTTRPIQSSVSVFRLLSASPQPSVIGSVSLSTCFVSSIRASSVDFASVQLSVFPGVLRFLAGL